MIRNFFRSLKCRKRGHIIGAEKMDCKLCGPNTRHIVCGYCHTKFCIKRY